MKYKLRSTGQYDQWFSRLKNASTKIRILARLVRLENGNFGDFKQLGPALFELRFFFDAELRIYYTIRHEKIVFLLAGGSKAGQARDIAKATGILEELED